MYHRSPTPYTATGLLLAVIAAFWTLGLADDDQTTAHESAPQLLQCELSFEPATLEAGTVHEEVQINLSEAVGEIQEVEVHDDSGLNIIWTHEDEEAPRTARVRVSAIGAEPGDWDVTLHGATRNCQGTITIVEGR